MKHEIDALEINGTWELTSLPTGKRAVGSKWVYKLKLKPDGTIDRYKASLVAKGYHQIMSIDFVDSFPLVAKLVTVRLILSVSGRSWPIHQWSLIMYFFMVI